MAIRTWYLNFPCPSPLSGVTLKNVFFSVVTTVITFQLLSLFCFIFLFPSGVSQNCLPKKLCLFSQACLTLCDPMDRGPPGSSVHGTLQARTLQRIAMPSCRRSSQPRGRTQVSRIADGFFTVWVTREAPPPNPRNCWSLSVVSDSLWPDGL